MLDGSNGVKIARIKWTRRAQNRWRFKFEFPIKKSNVFKSKHSALLSEPKLPSWLTCCNRSWSRQRCRRTMMKMSKVLDMKTSWGERKLCKNSSFRYFNYSVLNMHGLYLRILSLWFRSWLFNVYLFTFDQWSTNHLS